MDTIQSTAPPLQWQQYQELGYVDLIPILTPSEVEYFRHQFEQSCQLLGGNIKRLDGAHQYFAWAWQLSTHPALLDCIEQLLGPNIILKSSRFFCKHPNSPNFVGWHQDGFTEQESTEQVPTIWLGLTDSNADNGCLQVIPGSHLGGLLPHPKFPHQDNLTYGGTTAQTKISNITNIEMPAGSMSLHHPLTVHGSQPNQSTGPRIGFSASYATPKLTKSICPVAWVRGKAEYAAPSEQLTFIEQPAACPLPEAAERYQASLGHRLGKSQPQDNWSTHD